MDTPLIFLKLGGSLITDKQTPRTVRAEVLARLAGEIAAARQHEPNLRLLLGHGSGSFGHIAGRKYGTRQGVTNPQGWHGFAEVWYQASSLHRIVIEALIAAGLPALSFPASAGATAFDGQVVRWDLAPLLAALQHNLLPVVYGDVVFDTLRGGTILSTEDLFAHLAGELRPVRILLAGIDDGVWADYPVCTQLIAEIGPQNWGAVTPALSGSAATDVTGGMASKVSEMLALVEQFPGLEVSIFSGLEPGNLRAALAGASLGTRIIGNP